GGAGSDAILDRGGDDRVKGGLGNDFIETRYGHDLVLGQWGDDEFIVGTNGFDRLDGQHGVKQPAASSIFNDAENRLRIGEADVELDFVEGPMANQVTDVAHLDARGADGFKLRVDRDAVEQMTDDDNTLRLDFASDAEIQLDGSWMEGDRLEIGGVPYRRISNQGVTLIVSDLLPQQREGDRYDVNGDGTVSALDALVVINFLSLHGGEQLLVLTPSQEQNRMDSSGDNRISALDALQVINELGRQNAPEPEAESAISLEPYGWTELRMSDPFKKDSLSELRWQEAEWFLGIESR
ncbi:MAG: dockerin type I domain-containing protein, partial [Planctomycetota bacterium]